MDNYEGGQVQPPAAPTYGTVKPPIPTMDEDDYKKEMAQAPYKELFGLETFDTSHTELIEMVMALLPGDNPDEQMAYLKKLLTKLGGDGGRGKLEKVYRYLRLVSTMKEDLLRV